MSTADVPAGGPAPLATVLVVDDDPHLLKALRITLAGHGYRVTVAADGGSALAAAARDAPDLVVLDLGLPDMDGAAVLRDLRRWSTVPVLVLSARHGSADKVAALDAGADDYITKPFGLDELLARLRALLRRVPQPDSAPTVATEGFTVDLVRRQVHRGGKPVRLTPTEWSILEILVRNPSRLVSQQQLLALVWGPSYQKEANYLRVYMAQLRRKLEADPGNPRHLRTEPGMGYRFEP